MEKDQAFLEYVVKALVDSPEAVHITRVVDQMGVLLTLTVDKDDMGKVIGRDGATAKAIRTLLRVSGMKNDARVNLKINEPEGSERSQDRAPERSADESTGYVHPAPVAAPTDRMRSVDDVLAELTS